MAVVRAGPGRMSLHRSEPVAGIKRGRDSRRPPLSDRQPFPCVRCGSDDVPLGAASLELPHSSGRKFTFHGVPAFVCTECGVAAHAAWILADLFDTMNAAVSAGFEGNELEYVPRQRRE